MRTRIGIITVVMSGLWVWAWVLDAPGKSRADDGFDQSPLLVEMREAARAEAAPRHVNAYENHGLRAE